MVLAGKSRWWNGAGREEPKDGPTGRNNTANATPSTVNPDGLHWHQCQDAAVRGRRVSA